MAGITVSWCFMSPMRKAGSGIGLRRGGFIWAATAILLAGMSPSARGEQIRLVLHHPIDSVNHVWKIETGPLAAGADSVYCGGMLLRPEIDYRLQPLTGELRLNSDIACDSLVVFVFRLPAWLQAPAGHPAPQGKRLLHLDSVSVTSAAPAGSTPQRLSLSGNKSFSMTVGRSGEGTFSQGMDVDFDALMGGGLHLRGSISDRGGQTNDIGGGTTLLSELDKYFFEIEGTRFAARGGDIYTPKGGQLPVKRIKGISTVYQASDRLVAADVGRPPGRFISRKITGADGRQGPYQVVNDDGLPTAVVAGTEKVYLDGRLLESGADKEYLIDYPSGRITFSPGTLITARSRIEVDCEAAATVYDQAVYDVMGKAGLFGRRLTFGLGARRETDEKDRLRYGTLSAGDIDILRNAGDSASLAFTSGAVATAGGNYAAVDSAGSRYYRFVGSGNGEYAVSFSAVGDRRGDYRYLGDGVYEYVGTGQGSYLPINFLTLPASRDNIYGTLASTFMPGAEARLSYEGTIIDRNLFSTRDDDDNFNSRVAGNVTFDRGGVKSSGDFNFQQAGYYALQRVDEADYARLWAIPDTVVTNDEMRVEETIDAAIPSGRVTAGWGYLNYKDRLNAHRLAFSGRFLDSLPVSPRFEYRTAGSSGWNGRSGSGLFERQNVGASIKAPQAVRIDLDYERELTKNLYGAIPSVEKFTEYRGTVFFRRASLTTSRRIDFSGTDVGYKGPQADKIVLSLEETLGRLTASLSGTYLNLKRLDSDRADRNERLYSAGFHYGPANGWMTVQADYRQNRQDMRTSGYRYIQVQSGEGQYRYEDGRYLADPDGDYVRIREETGSETSVSVGQKSHTIMLYPGRIGKAGAAHALLAQTAFRLRTEVNEELSGDEGRKWTWILPWTSRSKAAYTTRTRKEVYSAMILPTLNYYVINLTYTGGQEEQSFGAPYTRDGKQYDVEIKNQISPSVRNTLQWRHKRTGDHGYGLTALQMVADEYQAGVIVSQGTVQYLPGITYLRFSDRLSGGVGRGIVFDQQVIVRRSGRGEIRSEVELRSLTEKQPFSQPEFLVTDGRRFGRSLRLNVTADYRLQKSWRITVNLTDRIFEGRPAEFTGRGELIAQF